MLFAPAPARCIFVRLLGMFLVLYFRAPLLPLPPEEIRRTCSTHCIAFLARRDLARLFELLVCIALCHARAAWSCAVEHPPQPFYFASVNAASRGFGKPFKPPAMGGKPTPLPQQPPRPVSSTKGVRPCACCPSCDAQVPASCVALRAILPLVVIVVLSMIFWASETMSKAMKNKLHWRVTSTDTHHHIPLMLHGTWIQELPIT